MKTTTKHRIKAYLCDNESATNNTEEFVALIDNGGTSMGVREVCNKAIEHGKTTISAKVMEKAVKVWFKEMATLLCEGHFINVGHFTASIRIQGVFTGPREKFNPEKQFLMFDFQQGRLLNDKIPSIDVEVFGVTENSIRILQVKDAMTKSPNDLLTPGYPMYIKGNKLKIKGDHETVGIRFRSVSNPEEVIPIPLENYMYNRPSEIKVTIPQLTPGGYTLEVTTQYSTNVDQLKEPRTTVFNQILTVK